MRSGQEPSDWSNSLRIAGDEIRWLFNAQSKGAFWGWKFTAYPVLTNNGLDTKLFSDKTALALPSLGLARSLLGKVPL